jgi:hypothetical protein
MIAAAASEPELLTVLRQIGRHTGLQKSKQPLAGIIELRTDGGPIELTIDEDAALALRTEFERFLTQ